jgi:hypothetical protein
MNTVESCRRCKQIASFHAMNERILYIRSLNIYSSVIFMLINHKFALIFFSKYQCFNLFLCIS